MSRAILVTGATGKQGGAVIKALLSSESDFRILAVTRSMESGSAQKLAADPRVTLVQGNLDDTEAIFEEAKKATTLPIWGVYSVQTPGMNKEGPAIEERQGNALIDSAIKHGVKHFVYSSVDRHGEDSTNNKTDIPHFASKYNIEHHLFDAAKDSDMSWTVLRPVAFMENFDGGFIGKIFATSWKLVVRSKPLQLVATDDIGVFAAKSFNNPEEYGGKCISIAGDELTYEKMVDVFINKTGAEPPHTFDFVARGALWMSKEMGTMFAWFEKQGYGADIAALKKEHPDLVDLKTWLEKKAA